MAQRRAFLHQVCCLNQLMGAVVGTDRQKVADVERGLVAGTRWLLGEVDGGEWWSPVALTSVTAGAPDAVQGSALPKSATAKMGMAGGGMAGSSAELSSRRLATVAQRLFAIHEGPTLGATFCHVEISDGGHYPLWLRHSIRQAVQFLCQQRDGLLLVTGLRASIQGSQRRPGRQIKEQLAAAIASIDEEVSLWTGGEHRIHVMVLS